MILLGTLVAAAASSEAEDWQPLGLVAVLLALAIVSDLLALQQETQRISGAFFAVVLAIALCGPAPAVAIGAARVFVDALRNRPASQKLLTNFTAYTVIPLVVGLGFEAARAGHRPPDGQRHVRDRGVRRLPALQRAQLPP